MGRPLPIACTLSSTDLRERGKELRALGRDALLDATEADGRAVLRFRPDPSVRRRVDSVVAAESECCAFLEFEVAHEDESTVLTISAPNGGAEMVHELAAALASD